MSVHLVQPERPVPPIAVTASSGGLLFCTTVPEEHDGSILPESIEYQSSKIFENLAETLERAGSSLKSVLHVTVYLIDIDDRDAMTAAWVSTFSPVFPARATIGIKQLAHPNMRIEITTIAAIGS